jgi:hypothetical protein
MLKAIGAACGTWRGMLLILWLGLDGLLYLGALLTLALAIMDTTYRPYTYGFTIALVTSWATRMAYGIWLELRRARSVRREKALKVNEILQKHGLSEDQSDAIARELRRLD